MDRLEAMIAIAQLRLRLTIIEKNPHLLEGIDEMEIKRPMELAGLKSRLARSQRLEQDIEVTGRRYDKVLDAIDELHGASKNHVGHLELQENDLRSSIERMVGSNGGPNDGSESSGESSGAAGQIISSAIAGS